MAGCKWVPEGGEIGLLSLGSPVMTLISDIERPELTDVDCFREKLLALDQVGFDTVELSYYIASISYYVKLCQAMSWFQNVPKSMMKTSRKGAS